MTPLYIVSAVLGYLLGSVNTSIILSGIYGKDIRKTGSQNAGATNMLRTYGKKAAAIVTVFDLIKGILAVLFARYLIGNVICEYIAGFAAILGHNFPLYFKFKGGKGVLTSLAVIIALDWKTGLIILIVAVAVIAITRYVSLGSIVGAVGLLVASFIKRDVVFIIFSVLVSGMLIVRHRRNIVMLLKGNERKLGEKKNE